MQQVVQAGVQLTVAAPRAVEVAAHDEPLFGRDELVEDVGELVAEQPCDSAGWPLDADDCDVVHRP